MHSFQYNITLNGLKCHINLDYHPLNNHFVLTWINVVAPGVLADTWWIEQICFLTFTVFVFRLLFFLVIATLVDGL